MRERKTRPNYQAQFKTFNSQQSCIDIYSKVQSIFLQKYFRYNLSDYFSDTLASFEQETAGKKYKNKFVRQLISQIYIAKNSIEISNLANRINNFYRNRSKIMTSGQFKHSFKHLYSNASEPIEEKELILVEVKIKVEIQRIQNLPHIFFKQLTQKLFDNHYLDPEEQQLAFRLKQYLKKTIHFFIVYFGDANFHIFNQCNYQIMTVKCFNQQLKVKIYVFYVSRLAMIDSFKKTNKLEHLQYINDILIQLYEMKRDKAKEKKKNKLKLQNQLQKTGKIDISWLKWAAAIAIGGVAIGVAIKYYK